MHRVLVLAALVEGVALASLGWMPGLPAPFPGLSLFFVAFGAYVWAAMAIEPGARTGGPDLRWIWAVAIGLRLLLIPLGPELSDDIYRYLWDGHVQMSGVNPYLFAPDDSAVTALRTSWHALINHPYVSTIYPPVAQGAFRVIALAGSSILAAKLLWLLLDLACGAVLIRVARETGRNIGRVAVLYLWSPLLIVETAWSGHLEVLGLLWLSLLLLVVALGRGHPSRVGTAAAAGSLLALAALTKFAPAAALPPLIRRHGWSFAAAFGAVVALFYVPFLDGGSTLWRGLATYARDWRFNEGAFLLLEAVAPGPKASRALAGAFVLAVVGWVTYRRFDAERALFWILGTGLLLSPTVHPWYVLWALPFAALRGSRPWILLTGLSFLGYWGLSTYHETGSWPQPGWVRALVWLPVWGLLVVDLVRLVGRAQQTHDVVVEAQADVSRGE